MKKLIIPFIMTILLALTIIYINPITNTLSNYLDGTTKVIISPPNEYKRDDHYLYVEDSENYIPYSYQDVVNIIYSFLNNGWENFTYYCPEEYVDCIKDTENIIEDRTLMTHINNYVHPFNSFKEISIRYTTSGEVNLINDKLYTQEEIDAVNNSIDIMLEEILNDKEDYELSEQLTIIHDHIINTTTYDQEAEMNKDDNSNKSNTAYGLLFNNKAICGGYTDTMAIILNRLNIPNYKIASNTHVWNALYINDEWLHLDLTWDDPVNKNNPSMEYLYHKYFLINNNTLTLEDGELTEHAFDKTIYLEFNY